MLTLPAGLSFVWKRCWGWQDKIVL
jgi:heme-degrading monooxygenase HmoA